MEKRVEIEVPLMNQIGMGSYSDRVDCDGLQAVVNLSNLELTSAKKILCLLSHTKRYTLMFLR